MTVEVMVGIQGKHSVKESSLKNEMKVIDKINVRLKLQIDRE